MDKNFPNLVLNNKNSVKNALQSINDLIIDTMDIECLDYFVMVVRKDHKAPKFLEGDLTTDQM